MHKVDQRLWESWRRLHAFLHPHGFYPVAFATALCVGLFAVRAYLSRSWIFHFLLWNLFLAWIPYLCSLGTAYLHRRYPRRWLLLLPPAAVGLADRPPIPLWYDIGMLLRK